MRLHDRLAILGAGLCVALAFGAAARAGEALAPRPPAEAGEGAEAGGGGEAEELEQFTDDLIILKSDLAIEGRVIGETEDAVRVAVEYGVITIPREAIERIEFNLLARVNELSEDDHAGRYRLAMRAVEMGMSSQARGVLEGLVGKEGVPPEIFRALAKIYELQGDLEKALEFWKKFAMARPDDEEAKERIAEIQKELGIGAGGGTAGGGEGGEGGGGKGGNAAAAAADGIEAGGGWSVLNWGNPAAAREQALDGNRMLMVQVAGGGKQDKAAVGKGLRLDLSQKTKLRFHAFNGEKRRAQIAIAIITTADYFESRPTNVSPDWNMNVSFDLQAKTWKCKATQWMFKTGIAGLDSVRQIVLLIYTGKQKATLYFDFIRAE
jgi:tetratricopeptide (TPR) repeat protein